LLVFTTVAVNVCGSPSGTDTTAGATVTKTDGGGGGGSDPTSPPQPRNDATRSSAGHKRDRVRVRTQRPRSFVLASIAAGIARRVPLRCIGKSGLTAKCSGAVSLLAQRCQTLRVQVVASV
jgi:hypothetical protein